MRPGRRALLSKRGRLLVTFNKFFDWLLGSQSGGSVAPPASIVSHSVEAKFKRDEEYESLPGIKEALAAIDGGNPATLVAGRAGTGKTRFVQYLRKRPGGELQATVAPTGVAALNAEAQTIHSFFRFPHTILDAKNLSRDGNFGILYRRMKRLVIDEISMVRADLIDAIDARLRDLREDDRPFGGVQIVMVGDFLQLPPVVKEEDWPLLHGLGYKAAYAFSAHALELMPTTPVILDRVWRQDDQDFLEMLAQIRSGNSLETAMLRLNKLCARPHREGVKPLILTARREAAERYNRHGLAALGAERVVFRAQVDPGFPIDRNNLPAPQYLELAVGARVMTVKNDMQGRWVNGSMGTVTGLIQDGAFVVFDRTKQEHLVSRMSWEKVRQLWNDAQKRIESKNVGAYRQIPLIPAWSVTIHKAQGLTLDDVRIDLGAGAFAPGQVYVALSRVRSLSGLSFAQLLRPADVKVDPMLLAFMNWIQSDRVAKTNSPEMLN